MPSFDIVSEIDKGEIDNAINQANKELSARFDFKGSAARIELQKNEINLSAEDGTRLKGLLEIVIAKLAKRNIDLRNVERKDPAISPLGHATQKLVIKQGIEGEKQGDDVGEAVFSGYGSSDGGDVPKLDADDLPDSPGENAAEHLSQDG